MLGFADLYAWLQPLQSTRLLAFGVTEPVPAPALPLASASVASTATAKNRARRVTPPMLTTPLACRRPALPAIGAASLTPAAGIIAAIRFASRTERRRPTAHRPLRILPSRWATFMRAIFSSGSSTKTAPTWRSSQDSIVDAGGAAEHPAASCQPLKAVLDSGPTKEMPWQR